MISAKKIISLSEDYIATKNIRNNDIVFYVNPTLSDYANLNRTNPAIRFIIDNKNKKVYAWNGYLATHGDVVNSRILSVNISCIWAQGKILSKGSLPTLIEFRPKNNDTSDYSWLSKYVKLPNQSLNKYYSNES